MARVLVVDDNEHIRQMLRDALEDEGYDVRTAADGSAALGVVRAWRPHAILLDLIMPRMNAWAFVDAYRQLPTPRAPIIAMTASGPRGARAAAELGIDDVVLKPLALDQVLAQIARCTASPDRAQ